jgi:DNA-binding NarL/FixJ family response regulator
MNWADPNFDKPASTIPSGRTWTRLTPAEDKKILDFRAAGLSFAAIGERVGRSEQTCSQRYKRLLRERNIPASRPAAVQVFRSLMTAELRDRQLVHMAIDCGLELVPVATLRKFADLVRADAIAEALAGSIK